MKRFIVAAVAAVGVFWGTMTASADTLPLPQGETLDLGTAVSVYDGKDSFFGARMYDWLSDRDSLSSLEKVIAEMELYPKKDTRRPREFAVVIREMLRGAKLFQLRTETADTYYQEFVVSVPVSDKNNLSLMDLIATAKPIQESGGKNPARPYEEELSLLARQVDLTSHTAWKEGITKSGHPYRFGEAKVTLMKKGFTFPLTLTGYVTRNDKSTVYTIFIGDQSSAAYFAPIVKKAIEGAAR